MGDTNPWGTGVQALAIPLPQDFEVRHSAVKRVFDVFFSAAVLILTSPLFLILAISILIASKGKGKVVYAHERIGRGGKPFRCYKFRTMYPDADARLKEILEKNADLKREWEQTYKLKNDPRVTPIGAFLRKTSLDEFPQFWNVLKGDLSVVGPRPVVQAEINKYFGPKAAQVLSVRPGLTGPWQVSGRSDTSYQKRIEMDLAYVNKPGNAFNKLIDDIILIIMTIPCMLSSRGAY